MYMHVGRTVREAREARNWSQADLARVAGTSQQNVNRIERSAVVHSRSLPAILKALGLSEEIIEKRATTPLLGFVGAGAEMFVFDVHAGDESLEEVERPQGSSETTVAVQVRGDSMKPAYRDGDLLYYDTQENGGLEHLVGHDCVIRLADGRTFIKELRLTNGQYWLHSYNAEPMLGVQITWAAKVKWVLKA